MDADEHESGYDGEAHVQFGANLPVWRFRGRVYSDGDEGVESVGECRTCREENRSDLGFVLEMSGGPGAEEHH